MELKTNENDIETNVLLLDMYSKNKNYDLILEKSNALIELFPLQPQYYYYAGLANNQMLKYTQAKEILNAGIDFVVNDQNLEMNIYVQLSIAFNGLGDLKNKEIFYQVL